MKESGQVDSVTDLLVDVAGAAVASWMGYQYVRDGDSRLADRLLRKLVANNPRLFAAFRHSSDPKRAPPGS